VGQRVIFQATGKVPAADIQRAPRTG
jgi:hypothetical protein